MSLKSNKIIQPEPVEEPIKKVVEQKLPKKQNGFSKAARYVLDGKLIQFGTFKFIRFLIFMAFLAFVFIANNYSFETINRQINKLKKETKELRYDFIDAKSKLSKIEHQSQIEKKLTKKGIKKTNEPIKILIVK